MFLMIDDIVIRANTFHELLDSCEEVLKCLESEVVYRKLSNSLLCCDQVLKLRMVEGVDSAVNRDVECDVVMSTM